MPTIELKAGNHYLCTCKQSKNFPFCDGSHEGTGKAPKLVELKETTEVGICGCGQSKNFPLCDGSHQETDKNPN